tara:strand:- start:415 stop:1059 length:645 start_codon:yes stop_codon:yes gene_type:complete
MNEQEQQLLEHFLSLPALAQGLILSENTQRMVYSIAGEYNLSENQKLSLYNEVLYVLLDLSSKKELAAHIKSFRLAPQVVGEILNNLNQEVLGGFGEEKVNQDKKPQEDIAQDTPNKKAPLKPSQTGNKEQILHDIEEPKTFEVLMPKTAFQAKVEEHKDITKDQVPETKEGMLDELRGSAQEHTEKEPPKNLFPEIKGGQQKQIDDPYREQTQ